MYNGSDNIINGATGTDTVWVGGDAAGADTINASNDVNLSVVSGGAADVIGSGNTILDQGSSDNLNITNGGG